MGHHRVVAGQLPGDLLQTGGGSVTFGMQIVDEPASPGPGEARGLAVELSVELPEVAGEEPSGLLELVTRA